MCGRDLSTFPLAGQRPACRAEDAATGRDHLRGTERPGLRVMITDRTIQGVTPLARLIQGALDALGWKPADAMRATGLSSQLLSQHLNRTEPYTPDRPPTAKTLQALEKIPGLTQRDILQAVAASTQGAPEPPPEQWSKERLAARRLIEQIPEKKLPGIVKLLAAALDDD